MTRMTLSLLAALALSLGCGDKDSDGDDGSDGSDGADGTADGADGTADGADGTADGADGGGDGSDGTEPAAEECSDSTDNDLDGLGDCTDDDCADDGACACVDTNAAAGSGELGTGDNSAATDDVSPGDSGSCGSEGGLDVVFAWSAAAAGCYQADTFGSSYDTVLRRVSACGGEELACDDDAENEAGDYTTQSKLVVSAAAAGDAFLFVVDGYGADATGTYSFQVNARDPLVSAVDGALGDATGAAVASGDSSTSVAVVDVDCGSGAGAAVTYSWTAPADGAYTFDTYGSSYDTILSLVDGQGCGELACDDDGPSETNNESEFTATVQGGVTYHLVISGYSAESGSYVLNINEGEGSGGDSGR